MATEANKSDHVSTTFLHGSDHSHSYNSQHPNISRDIQPSLQSSPFMSSATCHYTTTGTYTCAPVSTNGLEQCQSFYEDRFCSSGQVKQYPQSLFEELMGKKM